MSADEASEALVAVAEGLDLVPLEPLALVLLPVCLSVEVSEPLQPEDHLSGGGSGSLVGYLWNIF